MAKLPVMSSQSKDKRTFAYKKHVEFIGEIGKIEAEKGVRRKRMNLEQL